MLEHFNSYLQSSPGMAVLTAFLAGILTSFTPCVYPLIPITVGVIGAKSSSSRLRGFSLSLLYVLGMAVVYAGLGAFAALTGQLFGQISTSFWTYLIVGNIFFIFGLSMLDVFSLQLNFFQQQTHTRPKGALTVFMFGGLSGLIAGPCTTPVLGTLLTYVASRQNIAIGFIMLFVFAFGMGALLLVVGTFTGILASLPRSGTWMVTVKKAFGLVMLAAGEYFILKAGQLMI